MNLISRPSILRQCISAFKKRFNNEITQAQLEEMMESLQSGQLDLFSEEV